MNLLQSVAMVFEVVIIAIFLADAAPQVLQSTSQLPMAGGLLLEIAIILLFVAGV